MTAPAVKGDQDVHDFAAIYARRGRPLAALLGGRPWALPELRRRLRGDGAKGGE